VLYRFSLRLNRRGLSYVLWGEKKALLVKVVLKRWIVEFMLNVPVIFVSETNKNTFILWVIVHVCWHTLEASIT